MVAALSYSFPFARKLSHSTRGNAWSVGAILPGITGVTTMPRTFDTLNGGTRARLADLRRRNPAQPFAARYRKFNAPTFGTNLHALPEPSRNGAVIACKIVDAWRDVGNADEIVTMRHRGWFSDAYQSETYRGHVWQLPARDGAPLYVAGYAEPSGDYVILETCGRNLATYDEKEEAARAGDELARINADREREYSEKWEEAVQHDQQRDDARKALRDANACARQTIAALRDAGMGPKGRAVVLRTLRHERQEAREALRAIRDASASIAALDMGGAF
jgi:hypothetical protein